MAPMRQPSQHAVDEVESIEHFRRRWHEVDSRDIEVLLTEQLATTRASLMAHPERSLPRHQITELDALAQRLRAGEPLAYVLGYRSFYDLRLSVDASVLIPRPETELLVELALQRISTDAHVLDLGTGSGAIAIVLARRFRITATDRSAAALATARTNARACEQSIEFVQSNWFDDVRGRFDAIVSNPPYVAADHPALSTLSFEPQEALVAADGGFADLRAIASGAAQHLVDGGQLLLEHGFDQAKQLRNQLAKSGFEAIESHTDLAGIERVTTAVWPGERPGEGRRSHDT